MSMQYPSMRPKEPDTTPVVSHTLPSSKTISANIPLGPDRLALEKIISHLDQERLELVLFFSFNVHIYLRHIAYPMLELRIWYGMAW